MAYRYAAGGDCPGNRKTGCVLSVGDREGVGVGVWSAKIDGDLEHRPFCASREHSSGISVFFLGTPSLR